MTKFNCEELRSFNERSLNILNNKECVKLFKEFLKDNTKTELRDVFDLWDLVQEEKEGGGSVTDEMKNLMKGIEGFDNNRKYCLATVGEQCCRLFDEKVKDDFVDYLRENHAKLKWEHIPLYYLRGFWRAIGNIWIK